jgi:hypothetical protein
LKKTISSSGSQVDQLDLIVECAVPPKGGQCYELLMAMQNGKRLTVAKALSEHGCYALSQRMGELRREYGWPIQSRFIKTNGGASVKEYWL